MADDRLDAALAIAREAGRLAQKMRDAPTTLEARIKGPMDVVTAADHAVEALVRTRLDALDPQAAILGEEDGLKGDASEVWIVDPIDGTVNFARGMREWAISIARFDGNALTHGIIHAPDLGMTAIASRGQGAFLNEQRIRFDTARPQSPIVSLGYSPRAPLQGYHDRIARLLDHGIEHRRNGAATACLLGVLAGWFDAFYEPALNIWDAASGLLLVEEAGGTVRHDPFERFLHGPSDVLVSNGTIEELEGLVC